MKLWLIDDAFKFRSRVVALQLRRGELDLLLVDDQRGLALFAVAVARRNRPTGVVYGFSGVYEQGVSVRWVRGGGVGGFWTIKGCEGSVQ